MGLTCNPIEIQRPVSWQFVRLHVRTRNAPCRYLNASINKNIFVPGRVRATSESNLANQGDSPSTPELNRYVHVSPGNHPGGASKMPSTTTTLTLARFPL